MVAALRVEERLTVGVSRIGGARAACTDPNRLGQYFIWVFVATGEENSRYTARPPSTILLARHFPPFTSRICFHYIQGIVTPPSPLIKRDPTIHSPIQPHVLPLFLVP